jgi:16S rRNA (cytosine1402-N4)-methyltransferase
MVKRGPISGHTPVLLSETLKALSVQAGGRYIDCTLGGAGHAEAILKNSAPGGQLMGIDADPAAIGLAREKLHDYDGSVLLVNDNFANLQSICIKYDFFPVHGILFDLGLSSLQLAEDGRGFSFQHDAPLDMRFSPTQKLTAADIVNNTPPVRLAYIIKTYGEEFRCQRIAQEIINARPINSTLQLAQLIEKAIGRSGRIHPATRTFQALRIAVNHELENLESALKQAIDVLGYEGRLVVITYHSLEDRIVKQFLQTESRDCICPPSTPVCVCQHVPRVRLINKKVIVPSDSEIALNPRSRSAKLRAAERIVDRETVELDNPENIFLTDNHMPGWRKPALLQKIRMAYLAA